MTVGFLLQLQLMPLTPYLTFHPFYHLGQVNLSISWDPCLKIFTCAPDNFVLEKLILS